MSLPGLSPCGSVIHRRMSSGLLSIMWLSISSNEARLAKWVRLGPTVPFAFVPLIVWQPTQPLLKNASAAGSLIDESPCSPGSRRGAEVCRRLLACEPGVEVILRLRHNAKLHQRVLLAAELRALPLVGTRLVGAEPHAAIVVWDHVLLAHQYRHPEAVDDIVGVQIDVHGTPAGMCNSSAVTTPSCG